MPQRRKAGARRVTENKSSWSAKEDKQLPRLVADHETREKPVTQWSAIAKELGTNRTGKQCRERWLNHLRPGIVRNKPWDFDEEREMVELHQHHGNAWAAIANDLGGGRTENSVKNHWNATARRKNLWTLEEDECTPLMTYIKRLETDRGNAPKKTEARNNNNKKAATAPPAARANNKAAPATNSAGSTGTVTTINAAPSRFQPRKRARASRSTDSVATDQPRRAKRARLRAEPDDFVAAPEPGVCVTRVPTPMPSQAPPQGDAVVAAGPAPTPGKRIFVAAAAAGPPRPEEVAFPAAQQALAAPPLTPLTQLIFFQKEEAAAAGAGAAAAAALVAAENANVDDDQPLLARLASLEEGLAVSPLMLPSTPGVTPTRSSAGCRCVRQLLASGADAEAQEEELLLETCFRCLNCSACCTCRNGTRLAAATCLGWGDAADDGDMYNEGTSGSAAVEHEAPGAMQAAVAAS